MGAYEDNLRHLARPQKPSERREANAATIEDFQALWLADVFREYAHYADHNYEGQGEIAVAYASFIDQEVRDHGKSHVDLYAHTEMAAETVLDALYWHVPDYGKRRDYPMVVFRAIEGAGGELVGNFIEP
jgi:hypothetical protein